MFQHADHYRNLKLVARETRLGATNLGFYGTTSLRGKIFRNRPHPGSKGHTICYCYLEDQKGKVWRRRWVPQLEGPLDLHPRITRYASRPPGPQLAVPTSCWADEKMKESRE